MNNDKPASESSHSQQTKRERGLYHVKRNGYWTVAEYTDHHGQWRVFNNTDQMQSRDFEEIDERRIERGDSPTEQPGDSANKFNEAKWRIEYSKYSTYCNIIDADGYVGTIQGREKAELIAKAPEMAAEIERLKSQLKDYCNDCQHPTVNESQATELSKLRQENEAKRSDLTDKLEEAVHHMDNGHTAQATTLIYEVIGELEPKGE